jgi:hypothetical protein
MRLKTILLIINCFLLSSCITKDIHYTYEFKESDHGRNFVYGYLNNVYFEIEEKTKIENGQKLDENLFIYKEPYTLYIDFLIYHFFDLEKMTDNSIRLIKNNKNVDIRSMFIPQYNSVYKVHNVGHFSAVDEENKLLFKENGIINVSKIRATQRKKIAENFGLPESEINNKIEIRLSYEDIDVIYGDDKHFRIELDMTLEWEDGRIENKLIEANFKRKKIINLVTLQMLVIAWALSDS